MFLADQEVVDHPTQLICIWIFIGCQQTNTQDIGQFEDQEVETYSEFGKQDQEINL